MSPIKKVEKKPKKVIKAWAVVCEHGLNFDKIAMTKQEVLLDYKEHGEVVPSEIRILK